ncbi:hypothetical protein D3C79_1076870 [compost metagenome]
MLSLCLSFTTPKCPRASGRVMNSESLANASSLEKLCRAASSSETVRLVVPAEKSCTHHEVFTGA